MLNPLAIYIHWPFCLSKCPYCDFNSHVREKIDQTRFGAALRAELAWEAARLGPRRVTSIFFGGGTPSLMDPQIVADIIGDAVRLFSLADDCEITLEANPTSVESARLAAFRSAGVNRLSLGVQSLRDDALGFLGRQHDAAQARAALQVARNLFARTSFDMIYARPGQSVADWRVELSEALTLAADHLSLYQLTIEPGTYFETRARRGDFVIPDPDLAAELYDATTEEVARFGLMPYEVSNYAAAGGESRHNLAYWRYDNYVGIGPGAHGRIGVGNDLLATRRHRAPEIWLEMVERRGHGTTEETPLSPLVRAREALLMGLRLSEGINIAGFMARTGRTVGESIDADTLRAAVDADYLEFTPTVLRALPQGRMRLDSLLAALVV
jgi:oxygen-independent coproporphyrinogen-3 oxidase